MQVELKHLGFEQANMATDPYNKTLIVTWELNTELPWMDPSGEYDTIIHRIKPITLEKQYTPTYKRILDGKSNQ